MTWVFVGGEGCESKGGARGGRLVTFLDGGFRSGNSPPPKMSKDIQVLEDEFSYITCLKIYDKNNQQIAILRFFSHLFFFSFQVFQVWHLGKTFDKLGSVLTGWCQKKRKVMGHVKHPPQKDSPIFFPKWHPSNGTSRRMVPPVEEFDLPKPRWTKLTKEMASLFFPWVTI